MTDDLLQRATRALRDSAEASADDLAETRARLIWGTRSSQLRRLRVLRWLPLAAALAAGSAFAATPEGAAELRRAVARWFAPPAEPAPPAQVRHRGRPPRPCAASAKPDPNPRSAAAELPAVEPSRPAPRALAPAGSRAKPAHRPPAAVVEQPQVPRVPNPDLASYRAAHRLHFGARQDAEALAAWDAYLSAFPNGIFSLEARYNRAICLVRLGRASEAERALLPFARGEVPAAYRRDDARALIAALEREP